MLLLKVLGSSVVLKVTSISLLTIYSQNVLLSTVLFLALGIICILVFKVESLEDRIDALTQIKTIGARE